MATGRSVFSAWGYARWDPFGKVRTVISSPKGENLPWKDWFEFTGLQELTPSGIASTGGVGSPAVELEVNPTGITSSGSVGTPSVEMVLAPSGLASTLTFGTPTIEVEVGPQDLFPAGIAPTGGVGTPSVSLSFPVEPRRRNVDLAFIAYNGAGFNTQIPDKKWFAQHCDIFITSIPGDYTEIYEENPEIEVYVYYSGVGFYFPSISAYYGLWDRFRTWLTTHPEFGVEDAFFHNRFDMDYKVLPDDGPLRGNSEIITGYPAGIGPGYPSGQALGIHHSRMVSSRWGNTDFYRSWPIATLQRSSNGIVTVRTNVDTYAQPLLRIRITGAVDSSFDGLFDVVEAIDKRTFTIQQDPALGVASSSGGNVLCRYWNNFVLNIFKTAWTQFMVEVELPRTCRDLAGNWHRGLFLDSADMNFLAENAQRLDLSQEFLDAGSPSDKWSWMMDMTIAFWEALKDGIKGYRGDGLGDVSPNFGGPNYMLADSRLLLEYPPEIGAGPLLMEGCYGPNAGNTLNSNVWGGTNMTSVARPWDYYWKYFRQLMDHGRRLIFQANPYGTLDENKYGSSTITWTPMGGNIYYTDGFAGSKTPITYGGIRWKHPTLNPPYFYDGVNVETEVKTLAALQASTAEGAFYWDLPTGRFYVRCTKRDLSTIEPYSLGFSGLEEFWWLCYCHYLCWGKRNDRRGYFMGHAFGMAQYRDVIPGSWTYFLGLEYDFGIPAAGARGPDGSSYLEDLWGESTQTSSYGALFWANPTDSVKDRIWVRKFTKGLAFFRYGQANAGSRKGPNLQDPRTFPLPGQYRRVRADGTFEAADDEFTIRIGEGVLLAPEAESVPSAKRVVVRRA